MNTTVVGLLAGMALGFAGYFGGFGAFVVVAVLGAAGVVVGYLARREGPLTELLHGRVDGGAREDGGFRSADHPVNPAAERRDRVH